MTAKQQKLISNILGTLTFISCFLPCITFKSHHDCTYDDCYRVFYHGNVGLCVEYAIDKMFHVIVVLWWFAIMGGALILSKSKNAVSPFVFMSTLILFAVFGAVIDPAKWICTMSFIVSFILFIISSVFDVRIHQQGGYEPQ